VSATGSNAPDAGNPCLRCGACCAHFRVSFYWSEADSAVGGRTPAGLSVKLTPFLAAMRGTEKVPPRCAALVGEIGKRVRCEIHPLRPSPCREFRASWVGGPRSERCDRARAAHGLPPLEPPESAENPPL
jgi:Fe-S-cluster containining protein